MTTFRGNEQHVSVLLASTAVIVCIADCGSRAGLDQGSFTIDVAPRSVNLTQGGPPVTLQVRVTRQEGFYKPVFVDVDGLPAGVVATSIVLDPSQQDGAIVVSAAKTARQGPTDTAIAHGRDDAGHIVTDAFAIMVRGCAGCLDTTFGDEGEATMPGGDITALALDDLDRITVAAFPGGQPALGLYRYTASGFPDSAFHAPAIIPNALGIGNRALAIDAEYRALTVTGEGPNAVRFTRFDPSGAEDVSFGASGSTVEHPNSYYDPSSVLIAPSGAILATATERNKPLAWLARVHPDGQVDAAFGSSGSVTTDWGNVCAAAARVVLRDGMLTVAGSSGCKPRLSLAQYAADGSVNTSFGVNGVSVSDILGQATDVVVDSLGRIVVGGTDGTALEIARFTADGAPDSSFGTSGLVSIPAVDGLPATNLIGLAVQPDMKIVVLGAGNQPAYITHNYVIRLQQTGEFDVDFAVGGVATVDYLPDITTTATLSAGPVLQSDGRIVVGGLLFDTKKPRQLLLRFWP